MSFLKSVKMSLSSCSLSVEQMVLMKHASNTLRLRKFSGALLMMVYVNSSVLNKFYIHFTNYLVC